MAARVQTRRLHLLALANLALKARPVWNTKTMLIVQVVVSFTTLKGCAFALCLQFALSACQRTTQPRKHGVTIIPPAVQAANAKAAAAAAAPNATPSIATKQTILLHSATQESAVA